MRTLRVVPIIFLFSLLSHATAPEVIINESEFRAIIADRDITITLPIISNFPGSPAALLKLDLLDPEDKVVVTGDIDRPLTSGRNVRTLVLVKPEPKKFAADDHSVWYRVRYSLIVTPDREFHGIVALGAITAQMFDLTVAYPQHIIPGNTMQIRVHTANPVTHSPVSGVEIQAKPDFDDPTSASGITNSAGDTLFKLRIPATVSEEFSVDVQGRLHGLVRSQQIDIPLNKGGRIVINTDKLLYQPGQSLHARAMAFDDNNHAIANESATFTLRDPGNQVLLQDNVKTNAFGIANVDWELPDSAALGDYELEFEFADLDRPEAQHSSVRVSRYDLPNFTVTAKPDRTYYTPGQNAEVAVDARYLFGKELTHGTAKLVFRSERHWDYQEKKYISDKEVEQTAELDRNGHALFKVDLGIQQDEFKADDYRRFRDLDYAAYVTDPSTGKTEQRRLTLRLTHTPIHVYISNQKSTGGRSTFFVSTYYADGTPAECAVDISEDPQYSSGGDLTDVQFLRTVKTNRYGLAKVSGLKLLDVDTKYHQHSLLFLARDKQGRSANYPETLYGGDGFLVVSTDKSLYRPIDAIIVTLQAPELSGHLLVEAIHNGTTVWSGRVRLRDHRGFTVIPANLRVTGELTIAAYSMENVQDDEFGSRNWAVSRTVLFPQPTKLNVKLKTDHTTYRPGEDVSATMNVNLPTGGASPTALGVVVVDKAVEERIRTDEEFGEGHYGFWDWGWWYQPVSVGGISREDLDQLDLSQPLPDGLDLIAELILDQGSRWDGALRIEADSERDELSATFRDNIAKRLLPLRAIVEKHDAPDWQIPVNAGELETLLARNNISVSTIRDPWDQPFRFTFGIEYRDRYINIVSAGPDKKFDTDDDISAPRISLEFFSAVGALITRTIKETYAESGSYILNLDTLRPALMKRGLDLNALRDPWGEPYIFDFNIAGSTYQWIVKTRGGDSKAAPHPIWTSSIDYFADVRKGIDEALVKHSSATGRFPQSDDELNAALTGNNFRSLRDPWGNAYYVRFYIGSDYSNIQVFTYDSTKTEQGATPVTLKMAWVEIWSNGPDGKPHTFDDFSLASYSRIISQQSGSDMVPHTVASQPNTGNTGAIQGVITDATGAVIPNSTVTATPEGGNDKQTATTDSFGKYLIRNLAPGLYEVKAEAPAFRPAVIKSVPVHSSSITQVNMTLNVGTSAEMVTVSADAVVTQTSVSSLAVAKSSLSGTKAQVKEETFTPRVRNFFPETLYWSPSVITDSNGHAKLNFKLADNITTWKMSVLASTKDGRIGATDAEIQSFQPFFAELDPPKILTIGDFIELPVVVRNYLPKPQQVGVEMKSAAWFELQQADKQQITIPAGESANAIFPFRAISSIKSGKQQVSAANRELGDAIEKTVSVHPDGLEQSVTTTDLVRGSHSLTFNIPGNVIPGSLQGQLKIYPNLMAHVTESIEAGLHRPYGCGEQTISSTYPSVMLLQFEKAMGSKSSSSDKASHYLSLGLRRLLNYRETSGGFSYWGGHSEANLALTAYAVRFLIDASQVTSVDPDLINDAVKWLGAQQKADGSWKSGYSYYDDGNTLTAYVALTLSNLPPAKDASLNKSIADAVRHAFAYLTDPHRPIPDPYTLSQFALLAHNIGESQQSAAAVARLRSMSTADKNGAYWVLDLNTPFYGWGHAGRIESTAVTLLALAVLDSHPSPEGRKLLDAGALYLLRQKDSYGVWYSGQATVNVLKALLAALGTETTSASSNFTLLVNGRPGGDLNLPAKQFVPTIVDIARWLQSGDNTVTLNGINLNTASTAQAVATYYIPWTSTDSATEKLRTGKSEALRLAINYDRSDARVGDTIKCTVEAERIGSRGWGMMIAEIGLPPGADVDRESLNKVVADSSWTISHYDVLPDRLQLYLWPHAGGSKFAFTFRPRFGIKARTAPSQLYDYYNPEAEVSLAPTDFHVSARP